MVISDCSLGSQSSFSFIRGLFFLSVEVGLGCLASELSLFHSVVDCCSIVVIFTGDLVLLGRIFSIGRRYKLVLGFNINNNKKIKKKISEHLYLDWSLTSYTCLCRIKFSFKNNYR